MKTALISFRNITENYLPEAEKRLVWLFNASGMYVDYMANFSAKDEVEFAKQFSELSVAYDNVIVLSSETEYSLVKKVVCEKYSIATEENLNAKKFIEDFLLNKSATETISTDKGTSTFAFLPEGSTVIPNYGGVFQGFTLDVDNCVVAVLPNKASQFDTMCINYLLPYLENKYKVRYDKLTLKLFGVSNDLLNATLKKAKSIAENKIAFNVESSYGDVKLSIVYDNDTPRMLSDDALRYIVSTLKEKIYAQSDSSLAQTLFSLLNMQRKFISTAESFTAGRVINSIISVPGASAVVNEGIVSYSNHAKSMRLGVATQTLNKVGAVSKETAYEMATGLLQDEKTDYVIATTGIAGPKSDDTKKPVGLSYIAVGSREGIHIHKFELSGDREEITETAKNTALFLAIKHIKTL